MPGNIDVAKREEREMKERESAESKMKLPRPRVAVVIVVVAIFVWQLDMYFLLKFLSPFVYLSFSLFATLSLSNTVTPVSVHNYPLRPFVVFAFSHSRTHLSFSFSLFLFGIFPLRLANIPSTHLRIGVTKGVLSFSMVGIPINGL